MNCRMSELLSATRMQLELRLADSFVSAKHVLQQPKLMIDRRQRVWS